MNKFICLAIAAVPALYCTSCSNPTESVQADLNDILEELKECIEDNKDKPIEELIDDVHGSVLPKLSSIVAAVEDMTPQEKFEVWRKLQIESDNEPIVKDIEKVWEAEMLRRYPVKEGDYRKPSYSVFTVSEYVRKDLPIRAKNQLLDIQAELLKFAIAVHSSAEEKKLEVEYWKKKQEGAPFNSY